MRGLRHLKILAKYTLSRINHNKTNPLGLIFKNQLDKINKEIKMLNIQKKDTKKKGNKNVRKKR